MNKRPPTIKTYFIAPSTPFCFYSYLLLYQIAPSPVTEQEYEKEQDAKQSQIKEQMPELLF